MTAPQTPPLSAEDAREAAARSWWDGNPSAPDYAAADHAGMRGVDRYIFSVGWYSRPGWAMLTWLLSRDRGPFIAGRRAARAYARSLAKESPDAR